MKILFLSSTFKPIIGGAETYALNISKSLCDLGYEIEIVTDMVETGSVFECLGPQRNVRRLRKYRENFKRRDKILWEEMQFGLRPELAEIALNFQPDLMFSNSLDLCPVAKTLSIEQGIPWLATFHEQAPEREALGAATLAVNYGLLQPDGIVAGSQFYLERALKYAPSERCRLIHHGIDTNRFKFQNSKRDVHARYRIAPDTPLIVSVGRFKARKGFVDLIEAIGILARNGSTVSLIIAGSVSSASDQYLRDLIELTDKLDLQSMVHFESELQHDEMPWLLSGAEIVVQPSLEEGLGLGVIEAMSCNRPVIATQIPGHIEIIGSENVASLVSPNNPSEIAHAILQLLQDKKMRRDLASRARKHVVAKFSVETMAKTTSEMIQTMLIDKGA